MKNIYALILILLFAVSGVIPVEASETEFIRNKSVAKKSSALTITGNIPSIVAISNKELKILLNKKITEVYNEKLDTAKKAGAKSINFSYSHKVYKDCHSIIINTSIVSVSIREEVDSFVFKLDKPGLLNVNDVLGVNGRKLISQSIANIIKQNPGVYNSNFSGIQDNQTFYVENGYVTVVFNKYVLGPSALGVPTFGFSIDNVQKHTFTIGKTDYQVKGRELYNLKMIPLRLVCEALGFRVSWNSEQRAVEITASDFISRIEVGKNSYYQNKYPARTLEAPPEIINATAYVPISFFELILNASYTVEQNGNITFSVYNDKVIQGQAGL